MDKKFQHLEVVKVVRDVVTRKKQWRLLGLTGIITGWTDPYPDGRHGYSVHFNTFGEGVSLEEDDLESLGRIADRSEIVTRSRLHHRRGRC
jgi:hypothetical protein